MAKEGLVNRFHLFDGLIHPTRILGPDIILFAGQGMAWIEVIFHRCFFFLLGAGSNGGGSGAPFVFGKEPFQMTIATYEWGK